MPSSAICHSDHSMSNTGGSQGVRVTLTAAADAADDASTAASNAICTLHAAEAPAADVGRLPLTAMSMP